jgi:hypothetical protein
LNPSAARSARAFARCARPFARTADSAQQCGLAECAPTHAYGGHVRRSVHEGEPATLAWVLRGRSMAITCSGSSTTSASVFAIDSTLTQRGRRPTRRGARRGGTDQLPRAPPSRGSDPRGARRCARTARAPTRVGLSEDRAHHRRHGGALFGTPVSRLRMIALNGTATACANGAHASCPPLSLRRSRVSA